MSDLTQQYMAAVSDLSAQSSYSPVGVVDFDHLGLPIHDCWIDHRARFAARTMFDLLSIRSLMACQFSSHGAQQHLVARGPGLLVLLTPGGSGYLGLLLQGKVPADEIQRLLLHLTPYTAHSSLAA